MPEVSHQKPRLTRDELWSHLNANGYPISRSFLNLVCSPAVDKGPPVATYWGRRPLYDPDTALTWAEARCRSPREAA
jgi:hypothetical protein